MRIIIIEDEPLAASRLALMLIKYDADILIESTLQSIEDSVTYFNTHLHPDLVFSDIQLADGTCFSIFKEVHVSCPVIFTTAYDQYAIEAFSQFSVDYLLKPVTSEALARAMAKFQTMTRHFGINKKIAEWIDSKQKQERIYRSRFLVKNGNRMFFVEAEQVAYFTIDGKLTQLITLDGNRFPIDCSIEKLQEMLDPLKFFRLNRSLICNAKSIKEIRSHFNNRLKIGLRAGADTDHVIVSRDRVHAFKEWADN